MGAKSSNRKPRRKRTQFALEAPDADRVVVTGSFCDWNEGRPLKKDKKGIWKASLLLSPGRYEYRFLVDGQWVADPAPRERVPNPYGGENEVIVVTA
jgi:1,4-alpha-glucan branching enzyme